MVISLNYFTKYSKSNLVVLRFVLSYLYATLLMEKIEFLLLLRHQMLSTDKPQ